MGLHICVAAFAFLPFSLFSSFCVIADILTFGVVKGKWSIYDLFCKQWKGISFPTCWGVPQTPGPTKMCGPNTMRSMVACASSRTLLCRRHSKSRRPRQGYLNARAPLTQPPAFPFGQTRRQTCKAVLPAPFLIVFFLLLVLLHLLNP